MDNNGELNGQHSILCSNPGCFRPALKAFPPPLCLLCQEKTADEMIQLMADELTERIYGKIAERGIMEGLLHNEG